MKLLTINTDSKPFEEIQEHFDCLYSTSPNFIINKKIKIPYFYNIYAGELEGELNYNIFRDFYSKLQGANAVFVNDKKLNKYAEWLDLNSFWVPNSLIENQFIFKSKRFFTPKLHIGILSPTAPDIQILLDKLLFIKKTNWEFHITDKKDIHENCHIFLNLSKDYCFPNNDSLEAMRSGCVLISTNLHGNHTHIIFDDIHYIKLDFLDVNIILDALRYSDKRREKLERIALGGAKMVNKYFTSKNLDNQKLNIIRRELGG